MKLILSAIAAALFFAALPAFAQVAPAKVFGAYIGGHGVWWDSEAAGIRSDLEAGVSAKASLSPHISLVGSGWYGFKEQYYRYAGGVRITATDVDNPNFSIGIGYQYRGSGYEVLKPDEWGPDVTLGWRPWPTLFPDLIVNLQSWYGIDTNAAAGTAGLRYRIPF